MTREGVLKEWCRVSTIEKYAQLIRKAKVPDDEWETLPEIKPAMKLGDYILQEHLKQEGDTIELDLEGKERRTVGNFKRALSVVAKNRGVVVVFRYSRDFKRLYVRRIGGKPS